MTGGSEERERGVALFNRTWELIESRADDDRMLHMAHAQRYHWGEAPECGPDNIARGEWLVSRVYCILGRGEPALFHAERCLAACEGAGLADWDLAYAYEALARASTVAGDAERAASWRVRAEAAGNEIADPEDREHFERDFATLSTFSPSNSTD
jgi:hypothetical protein